MLVELHPDNPQVREIKRIAKIIRNGGLVIFPTDSVYALGCDIKNHRAYEQMCRIVGVKPNKAQFSLICKDLSNISEYSTPISTPVYKLMRSTLPGPFTYILRANNSVPKIFKANRKTIGIRVPDNNIALALVEELGNPIVSTSIHSEDEILDYITDPYEINEKFQHQVDVIIDGGFGDNHASTVIDVSTGEPEVIREGKGELP